MLDQYHLEQHHWVYARPAIVFAVQGLHHLVQSAKIHCPVYFPQQMLLWHQTVYANHLDYVTIHFPAFQHLSHHLLLILPLMNEKAQLMLDFFDRLRGSLRASRRLPLSYQENHPLGETPPGRKRCVSLMKSIMKCRSHLSLLPHVIHDFQGSFPVKPQSTESGYLQYFPCVRDAV